MTVLSDAQAYKPLPTRCSLSMTGLEECAIRMLPSRIYTLYVHKNMLPYATMLVKHMGAMTQDNPFSPCINVRTEDKCGREEWFIESGMDEAWGSEGV